MTPYSTERKQTILAKFLPPHNMTVSAIAREENISEQTLYHWQKQNKQPSEPTESVQGQPVPTVQPTQKPATNPDNWSADSKLATVSATLSLSQHELAEYCRTHGLHTEQITQWKAEILALTKPSTKPPRVANNTKPTKSGLKSSKKNSTAKKKP